MSENNVAFRLERHDEIGPIAFDRHFSSSSISKRLADFVDNYWHNAPPQILYWIVRKRCGGSRSTSKAGLSYPQSGLTAAVDANPLQ
jgi:hypothetical protein